MGKLLIVNADDLGMTRGVNRGIVEAHGRGIVTSATILANGPEFEDAISLVQSAAPRLAIGVHLNLSQFTPLSPPARIPSLVNQQGQFYLKPPRLWARLVAGKLRREEIELELRAQIRRVFDVGMHPDHLDGHMHMHLLAGVREIVIQLAHEFGIHAARCPKELPPAESWARRFNPLRIPRRLVVFSISRFAEPFAKLLEQAGLRPADHFIGNYYLGHLNGEALRGIVSSLSEGLTELMCHPGYTDAALASAGGRLQTHRAMEVTALTSPQIWEMIHDRGVQLTTYEAILEQQ